MHIRPLKMETDHPQAKDIQFKELVITIQNFQDLRAHHILIHQPSLYDKVGIAYHLIIFGGYWTHYDALWAANLRIQGIQASNLARQL